jgi:hypothetical protein
VGGNPPQTQKPRSQGAWPLNPTNIRGVKCCLGPARALAGPSRGRASAWLWPKGGPSPGLGHGSVIFSIIFFVFLVFHMFCILVLVFHVVHMYLFETWFFCGSLYFFVPTYYSEILFKLVASSIFFSTSIFSN